MSKKHKMTAEEFLDRLEKAPYKDRMVIAVKNCLLIPWKYAAKHIGMTEANARVAHGRAKKRLGEPSKKK